MREPTNSQKRQMVRTLRERQADPALWPTDASETEYMIDCPEPGCGSRMPPAALPFHARRHDRLRGRG